MHDVSEHSKLQTKAAPIIGWPRMNDSSDPPIIFPIPFARDIPRILYLNSAQERIFSCVYRYHTSKQFV